MWSLSLLRDRDLRDERHFRSADESRLPPDERAALLRARVDDDRLSDELVLDDRERDLLRCCLRCFLLRLLRLRSLPDSSLLRPPIFLTVYNLKRETKPTRVH